MSPEPDRKNLPKSFGHWTVVKQIDSRPDSNVFLATKEKDKAAIKVLKGTDFSDDTIQKRFHQEIFNLQSLDNPGVPKIIEFDLTNALSPWMAIEYVEGENLESLVSSKGVLKRGEWLSLLEKVSQTLAYVHSKGIYHRDISPSNIIIANGKPKLIDFGVSYTEDSELISMQGDGPLGTPATASPESFLSMKSAKMDMFSLASTFIFAGTGKFPFESEDDNKSNFQRISFDMPNFYDLSENQVSLLMPLLFKDPSDRISSKEFYEIVSQIQDIDQLDFDLIPELKLNLKDAQRKLVAKTPDFRPKQTVYRKFIIPTVTAALLGLVGLFIINAQPESPKNISSPEVSTQSANSETNKFPSTEGEEAVNLGGQTSTKSGKENSDANASQAISECYFAIETSRESVDTACLSAAKSGDLKSMYFLGLDAFDNADLVQAEKWLLKASKRGDYQSMATLVSVYDKKGDLASRTYWLKECANGFYGINETSPKSAIGKCKMLYAFDLSDEGKESTAIKYAKDAVSYGQGSAAYWLAALYYKNSDTENYVVYLKKAVDLGEDTAISPLLNYYESNGQEESALKLLDKLSKAGNQNANLSAAKRYFDKKNYSESRKYADQCASAGLTECIYVMGLIEEVEKNYIAAKSFFEVGYRQGNLDSGFRLGAILASKDKDLDGAEKVFVELANSEYFPGASSLVAIYLEREDLATSCEYGKKAIDLASKLKQTGKWKTSFESFLTTTETFYKDLCNV